ELQQGEVMRSQATKLVIVFSTIVLLPAIAQADAPALTSLEVFPPNINLFTARARQSCVVKATYADGITRDVTADAKFAFASPNMARLDGATIYPVADGATELKVTYGGKQVIVPIKTKDAKAERPISFKLDVMPVFMKAGCNVGS